MAVLKPTIILFTFSLTWSFCFGQAPCQTNFTGTDPCIPEPLGVATSCAGASETFQTNQCFGTAPTTSSCGVNLGSNHVWGTFTVAIADTYTITWTASNGRNIRLGLYQYSDPCLMTGETEVACANAGGGGVDETISMFLPTGTYYVCGMSSGNLSAASQICVSAPSIPAPIVASDCAIGVNVCTNLAFAIDPNGAGSNTNEIPPTGSVGNPFYDGFSTFNPWGTPNSGCLQIDESNSTWMRVNISGTGNLEFTFGGNGTQGGFYDWIMYPATAGCTEILSHTVAPVRCNWNGAPFGGTGLADVVPSGGDSFNFEPSLPVVAGEVYIICFSNYSSVQTAVPLEFGGTAIVSCTPLPVEMVQFAGERIYRNVSLEWITATETNNDYFEVERSLDGISFESIGSVDGLGTSIVSTTYEFLDVNPTMNKVNYYRLRQVDFDGSPAYSPVLAVNMNSFESINVYPNPTNSLVVIESKDKEIEFVRIENLLGEVMYESKSISSKVALNVLNYQAGTYIVQVWSDGTLVKSERLVVE